MKNLFTISPLLILIAVSVIPTRQTETATNIYVDMGSRGADCRGTGVCSIGASGGQAPPPSGYKATMGITTDEQVFIEFKYSDLPNEIMSLQFGKDLFEMQSDCPIPSNVLQLIGARDTSMMLKAGTYRVQKNAQNLRVTF